MKQSEQIVEMKTSNKPQAGQSKNSKTSCKGSLHKQEKELLSQIVSQDLHLIPEFSANYGLTKKQCQSQNVDNHFKEAFIKFNTLYRSELDFLAFFYQKLDKWFKPSKIMPGVPREFFDSIHLGVTLFIKSYLEVESENPEENFRALIDFRLKKYLTLACQNLDNKTKEQLEKIYQEFVKNPREEVFEFISGISEFQFMIHTDFFPSLEPRIYAKGQRLLVSQVPDIRRRFFHVVYSQKYQSFYDLWLKSREGQLADNLPFINEKLKVFREDCDDVIKFQLELMKNKPGLDKEVKMRKQQFLHQISQKSFAKSHCKRVNQEDREEQQQQLIEDQVQMKVIQNIQQRFAQHQEEVHQMEQNLLKYQIDNATIPYCSLYSFYELCQLTQKQIIKRLASHYRISLKQFNNPCYFVGLLLLSFQHIDKKRCTSTFDFTQSSLLQFAIQINVFKGVGKVHGSILGYQIVKQIQLPKYFAYILKDMLGQQAIVDENNPLRVFICPQCLCFDKFDHHDCKNK